MVISSDINIYIYIQSEGFQLNNNSFHIQITNKRVNNIYIKKNKNI
jgi:hypothetical protein